MLILLLGENDLLQFGGSELIRSKWWLGICVKYARTGLTLIWPGWTWFPDEFGGGGSSQSKGNGYE